MKQVRFMCIPESGAIRFHFVVPARQGWYDANVQPMVDVIIDQIPKDLRRHNRSTCTWEIPMTYWSLVRRALESNAFEVVEDTRYTKEGLRGTARDLAGVSLFMYYPLALVFLANFAGHFLHTGSSPIRIVFFLEIGVVCIFAVRFGKLMYLLFLVPMLWLFNPIIPIRIGHWFVWQVINLFSILVMFTCSVQIVQRADEERLSDRWWSSL